METKEQPQNLFLLCEDVLLEILKHLGFQAMQSLSLTSKFGYDVTKEYFGKQTKLKFSKALTLKELQALANSTRNYEEIVVSVYDYDDTILQQLSYLNMKVSLARLTTRYWFSLEYVRERISNLKTKYKIQTVLICYDFRIRSLEDIEQFKDANICTNDLTSISIYIIDFGEDIDEEFNDEIFNKITNDFQRLETLDLEIWTFSPLLIDIDTDIRIKIGTLKMYKEVADLNFLQIFQGIHTLIIEDCYDTVYLKALVESNINTLKTLHLNSYSSPSDRHFVVPCQLKTLKVSTDDRYHAEKLLSNQNELECLELGVFFTPSFLEMLGNHCPPTLSIEDCDYNSYYGPPAKIRPFIPELPMVKHLTLGHVDVIDFLPKTKNVETLKIEIIRSGGYRGFKSLNGLKLQYLKTLDIGNNRHENLAKNMVNEFSQVAMNLPNLEQIKSTFFNMALFQNYTHIKFLECGLCNFENIVDVLNVLTKLEELKVLINEEDLITIIKYLEFSDLGEHLKYVKITTREFICFNMADTLRKLDLKGDKIFCNFDRNEENQCSVNFTVDIDIKNNNFMYTLIKRN